MFKCVAIILGSLVLTSVRSENIDDGGVGFLQIDETTFWMEKQRDKINQVLADVNATIVTNIYENSRVLKLEDFSWGIFSGTKGRLQGFQNFELVNNETRSVVQKRKLNINFEFTVPSIQAVWEKSSCLGSTCAVTIELQNAVFVLKMKLDADECVVDHLAYLKAYDDAKTRADYSKISPMSMGLLDTTVHLLSKVLTTKPFEKIVKDNVNHALLQLPLFKANDIRRICNAYREI